MPRLERVGDDEAAGIDGRDRNHEASEPGAATPKARACGSTSAAGLAAAQRQRSLEDRMTPFLAGSDGSIGAAWSLARDPNQIQFR